MKPKMTFLNLSKNSERIIRTMVFVFLKNS
jgi:hypothetical protein